MSAPFARRRRAALAGLLALGASPGARAHAFLASASPAVGATVRTAPTALRIQFTEGVEPAFSRIAVTDAAGTRMDRGTAHSDGADTRLAVALAPLPPGAYRVEWHAVAIDTHRTEGSFGFTVAP